MMIFLLEGGEYIGFVEMVRFFSENYLLAYQCDGCLGAFFLSKCF